MSWHIEVTGSKAGIKTHVTQESTKPNNLPTGVAGAIVSAVDALPDTNDVYLKTTGHVDPVNGNMEITLRSFKRVGD